MTRFLTIGVSAIALTGLTACIPIPIKGNVSFVATEVTADSAPLERLGATEGMAILSRNGSAGDGGIAACVSDAFAKASPGTRIVPAKQVREAIGGTLAGAKSMAADGEIAQAMRSAQTAPALAALGLRYVTFIEGATQSSGARSAGCATYVCEDISDKRTRIEATIWNATTGDKLAMRRTETAGQTSTVGTIGIAVYTYAPTEATACKDMAGKLAHDVSGREYPAQ